MATVTKLKAAVNNKNLLILGEDGNLYSYYFGRYFNKIVEKGYTLTSGEITALNAFIQDGINNGWIDIVKYFLPLIGDSSHLDAATVPLIDEVGNYEMAEYDGTEDFSNSFEVNPVNNKIKYYTRLADGASPLKSPCTVASMNGGISFSGYMPTPKVYNDDNIHTDYYCGVKVNSLEKVLLSIRYRELSLYKQNEFFYLGQLTDSENAIYNFRQPSADVIDNLNISGKSLIINYAIYKDGSDVWRFRNYFDANGGTHYNKEVPAGQYTITYSDYSGQTNKLVFANPRSSTVSLQKLGCLGVLDAPNVTKSLVDSYNSAVFTLMTALGK